MYGADQGRSPQEGRYRKPGAKLDERQQRHDVRFPITSAWPWSPTASPTHRTESSRVLSQELTDD